LTISSITAATPGILSSTSHGRSCLSQSATGRPWVTQREDWYKSPLEMHADFLLGLIEEQPDLTLSELVSAMRRQRIAGSRTAVWRFFQRHKITFKKKPARSGAGARGRGAGAAALDERTRHA
jgi:hypothetical protein